MMTTARAHDNWPRLLGEGKPDTDVIDSNRWSSDDRLVSQSHAGEAASSFWFVYGEVVRYMTHIEFDESSI